MRSCGSAQSTGKARPWFQSGNSGHVPSQGLIAADNRKAQLCLQTLDDVERPHGIFNQERSLSSRTVFKQTRAAALVGWRGLFLQPNRLRLLEN